MGILSRGSSSGISLRGRRVIPGSNSFSIFSIESPSGVRRRPEWSGASVAVCTVSCCQEVIITEVRMGLALLREDPRNSLHKDISNTRVEAIIELTLILVMLKTSRRVLLL